jgi:hypothetical protein
MKLQLLNTLMILLPIAAGLLSRSWRTAILFGIIIFAAIQIISGLSGIITPAHYEGGWPAYIMGSAFAFIVSALLAYLGYLLQLGFRWMLSKPT